MKPTKTSSFVLPILGCDRDVMAENGFLNTYIGDENSDSEPGDILALTFDHNKVRRGFRARMRKHKQYINHYSTDEILVIQFTITKYQYKKVVRHFLEGAYSRISSSYVEKYFKKYRPDGTKSLN